MVDEHRAGASLRAGYGGAEAKLGEQTAGPVGWSHRGMWSELVVLAREIECTKNGTHQHQVCSKKNKNQTPALSYTL